MKKMMLFILGAYTSGLIVSIPANAINLIPNFEKNWLGSLSVGASWSDAGKNQNIYLTPSIENAYVATDSTNTFANGELFLGKNHSVFIKNKNIQYKGQLGLALGISGNAILPGEIWSDADPEFNNYTYQYKVQHSYITIKEKIIANMGYSAMPWISGRLGLGFNRAHSFVNTPTIFEAIAMNNFSNSTESSFTYGIGVGLLKPVTKQWALGIGYEFSDWGTSSLDKAPGQSMNSGLSLSHLYTNNLKIELNYTS